MVFSAYADSVEDGDKVWANIRNESNIAASAASLLANNLKFNFKQIMGNSKVQQYHKKTTTDWLNGWLDLSSMQSQVATECFLEYINGISAANRFHSMATRLDHGFSPSSTSSSFGFFLVVDCEMTMLIVLIIYDRSRTK